MKLRETKALAQNAPVAPTTGAGWRARIGELENEAVTAGQALAEKRMTRRTAAGALLVFGGDVSSVPELEAEERDAERRKDSLVCALELARAESFHRLREAASALPLRRQSTQTPILLIPEFFSWQVSPLDTSQCSIANCNHDAGINHWANLNDSPMPLSISHPYIATQFAHPSPWFHNQMPPRKLVLERVPAS